MRNRDLEALLDPDDDGPCLVYGDWLQQHGDPLGELIQIQHRTIAEPRSVPLRRREAELFEAHGEHLVGYALAHRMHMLDWRCGFVRSAQLATARELVELRAHPAGRLLVAMEGGAWVLEHLTADVPALRALSLGLTELSDVRAVWTALPALTSLILCGGPIVTGSVDHARLRTLSVTGATLSADNVRALAAATLPALTTLELELEPAYPDAYRWYPGAQPVSEVTLDGLVAMFANPRLGAVRELAIRGASFGDALCAAIANAPFAPQLRRLDLRVGTITDAGAARLADRARFSDLEQLMLDENQIASEAIGHIYGVPLGPQYLP